MEFTVTARNGDSVRVESDNWLAAIGKALGFFDADLDAIAGLTCTRQEAGVWVELAGLDKAFSVRESDGNVPVKVTDRSAKENWAPIETAPPEPDIDPSAPRPDIAMPEASLRIEDPKSLAERMFELGEEIDSLSTDDATMASVKLAAAAAGATSAAAALGTLDEASLQVRAAHGRNADLLRNRFVNFGEGMIGLCFDMASVIADPNVDPATLHLDPLSDQPAIAVLCVPLVDDTDTTRGVLQLLNPTSRPFVQSEVDAVVGVAKLLARSLANR